MPHVSWSEVRAFRTCMKKHDYQYRQRLRPRYSGVALLRGSVLHEMLDALINHKLSKNYKGKDPWGVLEVYEEKYSTLFVEEQETYGNFISDCGTIFENYVKYYRDDPLTYEASEAFVATDLTSELRLIGYIDKVATDDQGRRWLMDHKFVKVIPGAENNFLELQLLIYLWAWNRFNPTRPIAGIIWDHVRTKLPVEPAVLKKGGLSQRKDMDTTPGVYLSAIHREGLDPLDYADMLELLQGKEDSFFHRVQLPRPSPSMVDKVIQDFRATALMIQSLKGIAPRTMDSRTCQGCNYRKLCEAEVRGLDAQFIQKSEFIIKEKTKHG